MSKMNVHSTSGIGLRSVTTAVHQQFQGPLPPPEMLKGYDQTLPGSAHRILTMAEGEQIHRHVMEERSLKYGVSITVVGQLFGLIIALVVVIGGFVLIFFDKTLAGLITLLPSLGGLVMLFIYGKNPPRGTTPSK